MSSFSQIRNQSDFRKQGSEFQGSKELDLLWSIARKDFCVRNFDSKFFVNIQLDFHAS